MRDLGHQAIIYTKRTQCSEQVGQACTIPNGIRNKRSIEIGPKADALFT